MTSENGVNEGRGIMGAKSYQSHIKVISKSCLGVGAEEGVGKKKKLLLKTVKTERVFLVSLQIVLEESSHKTSCFSTI